MIENEMKILNENEMKSYCPGGEPPSGDAVSRIRDAVREVTGMNFDEYTDTGRKRDGFFARMLFARHCKLEGVQAADIARRLNRDRSSINYMLNKYGDERRFNPAFRKLAEGVENALNYKL